MFTGTARRCDDFCFPEPNFVQFIDLYPKDMDSSTLADLSLRRMFCDFLGASLLVVIARGEDAIEPQVRLFTP